MKFKRLSFFKLLLIGGIYLLFLYGCVAGSNKLTLRPGPQIIPGLSIDVTSYSFPSLALGSTTSTLTLTITNNGLAAATGCTAATKTGTDAAEMAITQDNCSTNDLSSLASCTISVQVTPVSTGTKTAGVSWVCTLGGTVATDTNGLSVRSIYPSLSVVPATRNFGNVLSTASSDLQTIIIQNAGDDDATGCTGPSLQGTNPGDFALSNNTCPATLVSSSSCSVDVQMINPSVAAPACTVSFPCTYGGTVGTTNDGLTGTQQTTRISFSTFYQDGVTSNLLAGPTAVAISPDLLNVYVATATDNAIEAFTRNLTTGALTYLGAVQTVNGASGIAVSPDGRSVYAVSSTDNSINAYTRTLSTGSLTVLGSWAEADACAGANCPVSGMNGPSDLIVSPDGMHVYVSSATSSAVAVFARTLSTGSINFASAVFDDAGGFNGLQGAQSLTISPDGLSVYVAGTSESAVAVLTRTVSTGTLNFTEVQFDSIASADGLQNLNDLTVSRDGKFLYSAGTADNAIGVYMRDLTTGTLAYVEKQTNGVAGVDGIGSVMSVKETPDGKYLLAIGQSVAVNPSLSVFERNLSNGRLTYTEMIEDNNGAIDGFNGASDLALTNDGLNIFVTGATDDDLAAFTYNLTKIGQPSYVRHWTNLVANITGMDFPAGGVLSPDGLNYYAAGTTDNTLLVFSRDVSTGSLTWLETHTEGSAGVTGLTAASSIAVTPDGLNVYAVGSNNLAMFRRDRSTGKLTFGSSILAQAGMNGGGAIVISKDGKSVYTAGATDNSVVSFVRNLDDGTLTYATSVADSNGAPVDGIEGTSALALSNGNDSLYATGATDNGVVHFLRDLDTGTLTHDENILDGVGGVSGLVGASSVVVSLDGLNVYTTGATDDALSVFTRNVSTGRLTYSAEFTDLGGDDGLNGANSLSFHPSQKYLYATGNVDDALVLFTRDPSTGALTYTEVHKNFLDSVLGLDGANRVWVAPDGNHLYLMGEVDDAVILFDID